MGRREEALEVAREAVELYRRLYKANAEAFRSDLARSIGTVASISEDAGDFEQALDSSREALILLVESFTALPEAYLGSAKFCLGIHLRSLDALGREPDEATLAPVAPILATLQAMEIRKGAKVMMELVQAIHEIARAIQPVLGPVGAGAAGKAGGIAVESVWNWIKSKLTSAGATEAVLTLEQTPADETALKMVELYIQ